MRKVSVVALAFLLALAVTELVFNPFNVLSQVSPGSSGFWGSTVHRAAGRVDAKNYGTWVAKVIAGNAATGASTLTFGPLSPLADGTVLSMGLFSGQGMAFVPILINDGSPEVPTSITAETVGACPAGNLGIGQGSGPCVTIAATFASVHGQGATVLSGSGGLQEAINDVQQQSNASGTTVGSVPGGGVVVIDNVWQNSLVGSNALGCGGSSNACNAANTIAALTPYENVFIADERGAGTAYLAARPTAATAIAAPSAPTLTAATGSMTNGQYFVAIDYVDVNGQLSPSSETQSGATVTGITVTAPAAATGAVGYVVLVSAQGGATHTEKNFPLTSSQCTLTKIETIIPACAVANTSYGQSASNATILTNPATTGMTFIGANAQDTAAIARQTMGYVPVGSSFPFNFTSLVTGQATQAATAQTYEVGVFNLPAGFMNALGKKTKVCTTAHVTSAANSETLTMNVYYGPYNNADTKLVADVSTAFSGTTLAVIDGCFNLVTTATGATGTELSSGELFETLAGTAAESGIGLGNTTISNGSLPLTTNQQMRIEAVVGVGAFGSAITFDSLSIEQAN